MEKQRENIARLRAEMGAKAQGQRRVVTRAKARILEDVHLEGTLGRFTVHADEPRSRGGTERGPSPLEYIMVGIAF